MEHESLRQVESILNHLKNTDGYQWIIKYFELKKQEVIEDLLPSSGNLTPNDILEANTKMIVYEELSNFSGLIAKDIKNLNNKLKNLKR